MAEARDSRSPLHGVGVRQPSAHGALHHAQRRLRQIGVRSAERHLDQLVVMGAPPAEVVVDVDDLRAAPRNTASGGRRRQPAPRRIRNSPNPSLTSCHGAAHRPVTVPGGVVSPLPPGGAFRAVGRPAGCPGRRRRERRPATAPLGCRMPGMRHRRSGPSSRGWLSAQVGSSAPSGSGCPTSRNGLPPIPEAGTVTSMGAVQVRAGPDPAVGEQGRHGRRAAGRVAGHADPGAGR